MCPVNKVIKFTRASDSHYHNTRYATHGNFYVSSVRTTRFGLKGLKMEGAKLWEYLQVISKRDKLKYLLKHV